MAMEKENLKELLEKFLPANEAAEAEYNIRQGENIFRNNPSPLPSERLLSLVKAEVAARLNVQKTISFRRIAIKAVTAAALFFMILSLTIFISLNTGTSSIQQGDFFSDDQEVSIINAEVEQIRSDLASLMVDENGSADNDNLIDIEMQLNEINSNFWKG